MVFVLTADFEHRYLKNKATPTNMGISMLVTDVGYEMCWRQASDVNDRFDGFITKILYLKLC